MTTLVDLKRAIDEVDFAEVGEAYQRAKAHAWRTAFEWRDTFGNRPRRDCLCQSCKRDCVEYDSGIALIREKLP